MVFLVVGKGTLHGLVVGEPQFAIVAAKGYFEGAKFVGDVGHSLKSRISSKWFRLNAPLPEGRGLTLNWTKFAEVYL